MKRSASSCFERGSGIKKGGILSKRGVWEEFMPLKMSLIQKELFEEERFFQKGSD